MSDVKSDPTPTPEVSPAAPLTPKVDLSQLDDKHLSRYRHPYEWWTLLAIVVAAVVLVIVLWAAQPYIGSLLSFLPGPMIRFVFTWIQPTRIWIVLLVVLALATVGDAIAQSTRSLQLMAQAVEFTPTTFPQLAPIVDELRRRFDMPRTRVFASRDAPVSGYAVGVREPYSIVFSTVGVGALTPDEFKFVLGRQMGHIKLGHTLAAMVMGSAQMSLPQPFSFLLKIRQVIFGSYQHAQELSADRVGVVATRDVKPALSALIKQNLGTVRGAKIDFKSLSSQTAELGRTRSGATLRLAQRLSAQPFTMTRLMELTAWAGEPEEAPATTSPAPASPQTATAAAATAASERAASTPTSTAADQASTTSPPAGEAVSTAPASGEAAPSAQTPAGAGSAAVTDGGAAPAPVPPSSSTATG